MNLESVKRIAVIGLGRMGHGIVQCFASAGYQVAGYDTVTAARESLHTRVEGNLREFVANGLFDEADTPEVIARIEVAKSEAEAASGAQFVVEALTEQAQAKIDFFQRIEAAVSDDTILASNSSTFTISESAVKMRRPQRAIVTHWFNPPHIVPTVEVVPGPDTDDEVVQCALQLHRAIGKTAVHIRKELPGFLVNRIQVAMLREVWDLYEQGVASAEDIDAAIRGSVGFRLATWGPLGICDFGGLDIWSTVYQRLAPELRSDTELHKCVGELFDAGKLGVSSGEGFHSYREDQADAATKQRDQRMLQLAKLLRTDDEPA